jgi:hypothetical protein
LLTAGTFTNTALIASASAEGDPLDNAASVEFTVLAPEIDVQGNGLSIPNGDASPSAADNTDFGSAPLGSGARVHTFTIRNTGTTNLLLTGSPALTLSAATHFTVTQPVSTSISPGQTVVFTLSLDLNTEGQFTDTVNIASNDANENPYTFVVSGSVNASYPLSVNITGEGAVNLAPPDMYGNSGGATSFTGVYTAGTVVTMTAVPSVGWQLKSWSGDGVAILPQWQVQMDGNKVVTATFTQGYTVYLPLVTKQ